MADAPVEDQAEHPGEQIAVQAAGAIPWRVAGDRLEVLLIHRPRYDDWSWPKGKLDPGETLPECAAREVREEIGIDARLGIPLPTTHYRVSAGLKAVHYWAMQLERSTPVRPDGEEVDQFHWCGPEEAELLLSNQTDVVPLEALVDAHRRDALATRPLILLRHAKAKPRSSWTKAEGDRTLAATGVRQAEAVGRLLTVWKPVRVVTSPWRRCLDTVLPYVRASRDKVKIRLVEDLTEHRAARKPRKAAAAVVRLFDKRQPAVLCTHRPVLPTILDEFRTFLTPELAAQLPASDPYLTPGELIVFHVPVEGPERAVAIEQVKPYDD
ncbi:ADP-ribose pyrophosphatase [Sinomonas cyclohexanicum]|uniref:ADP-ribose pyrophosphatase n=1 Tax=Sinomonas cyclohexanicum TaxID=322009 RepID=A0ABM7PYR3_SINCY|nr:NUDIX hydrolase [Corynebacterium cyclohexanicum]BCT77209.1 ADP-ribose pyrophosphatase [Corynebacterium cyclohexanicum]